jgi:putative hydrolase of the HAD superfamily
VKLRAVVFDLFGTLVSYPPGAPHVHAMAARLGVPYEALRPAWSRTRQRRDAGELDTVDAIRLCCEEIGLTANDEVVAAACGDVSTFIRGVLVPREDGIATLFALRQRGVRLGLISDASLEVARVWPGTAFAEHFDRPVFSSEHRRRKPDRDLYRLACERSGVAPSEVVYVGNGDGDELAGAVSYGMCAVLFTAPGEFRGRDADGWQGPRISSLAALLPVIDALSGTSP